MSLKEKVPTIFSHLSQEEQDLNQLRYFVVANENYEDMDDEEVDVFDPNDYNYLVYITERLSNVLGLERLELLANALENKDYIENFLASEEDLFGVKSSLDEDELALKVLEEAESILKENS